MKIIFSRMRNPLLATFALMGVLAVGAFAADVTGKYDAETQGRNGTQKVTFDLKADGNKLTGKVINPRGETPIEDGKIDGDTITFTVTRKMGDNDMKMMYTGKVSGDSIDFTSEMAGGGGGGRGPQKMTAKKQ